MKKYVVQTLLLILLSSLLISCTKQKDEFGVHGSFIIEFGTVCGWCAGEETMTVSSVKVDYMRHIPCGENKGTTNKTDEISEEEWNAFTSSFDYSWFLTLDYNECNVCADGCDEYIKITSNGSSHEIRYSPSKEIEGMNSLREKLNNLMNKVSSD